MSMKLQLQVGKRYVLQDGGVTDPLRYDAETNEFLANVKKSDAQGILRWNKDCKCTVVNFGYDIVSEYAEPSGGMATYIPPKERLQPFDNQVDDVLDMVGDMLKSKNKAYGNSALDPIRVFSKADPVEQLNVRIDDKLSRIMRGTDSGEDTELDLIGYLIIRRIAKGGES